MIAQRYSWCLPFLFICLFAADVQAQQFERNPLSKRKIQRRSAWTLGLELHGGFAIYNGITTPDEDPGPSGFANTSSDSQNMDSSKIQHRGVPIGFGAAIARRTPWDGMLFWGIDYTRVAKADSSASAAGKRSPSYARLSTVLGTDLRLQLAEGFYLVPETSWVLRRRTYGEMSTKHNVDYTGPRLGMGLKAGAFMFEAFYERSIWARLGMGSGEGFSSKTIPGSVANADSMMASVHYALNRMAQLKFGVNHERSQIVIRDVGEYQSFGVVVPPQRDPTRRYDLSATLFEIGFERRI